jgi:hypothetical protein
MCWQMGISAHACASAEVEEEEGGPGGAPCGAGGSLSTRDFLDFFLDFFLAPADPPSSVLIAAEPVRVRVGVRVRVRVRFKVWVGFKVWVRGRNVFQEHEMGKKGATNRVENTNVHALSSINPLPRPPTTHLPPHMLPYASLIHIKIPN